MRETYNQVMCNTRNRMSGKLLQTWAHRDDPSQGIHQVTDQEAVTVATLPRVGGGLGCRVCRAEGLDVCGVIRQSTGLG